MEDDTENRRLEQFASLVGGWFWETDSEHRFVYLSDSVEAITGVAPEWHYGKSRMELRGDNVGDADWDRHIGALDSRWPFRNFRFKRVGPDGTRWVSTSGDPFFDESGDFLGYRGVAKDVTSEVALSDDAERSRSQLLSALEIIDEGFVFYDRDDRLVLCNENYRQHYPLSRDLMVTGARFEDIIRGGAERGEYTEAIGRIEEWIAERLAQHNSADTVVEQKLSDGRWLMIAERRAPDGGIVGMRVDITALKNAQEAAENASRAKSEFLATMNHELRTPLTSLNGSLRLLDAFVPESLGDRGKDLLDMALRNGEAMLHLVNELLDYEKVLSGTLVIENTRHDICRLTAKCLRENEGYASAQQVAFVLDTPDDPVFASVHGHRFKQVMRNLLSNGAKFSPPGGEVRVSVSADHDVVRVNVADDGPGIPDDFVERIFEPFTQADSSSTREKTGTGLGLSISKALTEGMGGAIDFETEVGVGSTFRVSFPTESETIDGAWSDRRAGGQSA